MADLFTEAFKELDFLNEDMFDLTDDGIEQAIELTGDVESDSDYGFEEIIDPLAISEEDLQESYIGKVIIDCDICHSKIYKDAEDIVYNADKTFVNVGEKCPYCQSSDGYKVIGQVTEYDQEDEDKKEEEIDNEDIVVETEDKEDDEEIVEESIKTRKGLKRQKEFKEAFDNATIETDGEVITLSSVKKDGEAVIGELKSETEAKFDDSNVVEDEFEDVDLTDFNEEDFDALGEGYLKKVYENVHSFKTTKGTVAGNNLKLEGVIKFKSGKSFNTQFVFEAHSITKSGKLKFIGENRSLSKAKAFTLLGKANKGVLQLESLNYKYKAKDHSTGKVERVQGRVVR